MVKKQSEKNQHSGLTSQQGYAIICFVTRDKGSRVMNPTSSQQKQKTGENENEQEC